MKHTLLVSTCLLILGSICAHADTTNLIIELVPFAVADGARESDFMYGHISEGATSYCQLSIGYGVQITRVDGLGGALVETQLVNPSNWFIASAKTGCTTYYGLDVWGDNLQFGDTFSDQIWRVNKHTGALTLHISKEAITNALGTSTLNWTSPYMTDHRDGAVIFYETGSGRIVRALDSNTITTIVSSEDFSNAFGYATVAGGMTMDPYGNLYMGSGTSGATRVVIMRATNGTLSVAVPTAALSNLVKESSLILQDIFYAPDGWMYLAVSRSGNQNNIVRFVPTNPVESLELVLSKDRLFDSIAGNQVASFDWHNGLTWHVHQTRKGVYSYLTDLAALLTITGAAEIVEYTTNAPYTCTIRLTNGWGAALAYERTSTASWSIIGDVPQGVLLENNLLTVGAVVSNTVVTLQAASTFGTLVATGAYAVMIIPEPVGVALLALACWRGLREHSRPCC